MIILDIETTGTDAKLNCMLSLGAIDYYTGREFYGECSIYEDSRVDDVALEINGFSYEEIQPGKKQPAHILYLKFFRWSDSLPDKLLAGHNVGHLDILFLEELHKEYMDSAWPFGYRTLDLHSVAFTKFKKSLNHPGICKELGLPTEPKPHNALTGARSERDAFKLLLV